MMVAQRQRLTSLSVLRRLSTATLDEDNVSPADGDTNSTQLSDFVKCVNKGACASQRCSFLSPNPAALPVFLLAGFGTGNCTLAEDSCVELSLPSHTDTQPHKICKDTQRADSARVST